MIDVSHFAQTLNGKPVATFGLGLSNMAVVRALVKAGVEVVAWDDRGDKGAEAAKHGAALTDWREDDFSRFAALVLAPGVPLLKPEPHAVVKKAREAGIDIYCDIEILHRCDHGRRTIGITGTNGKSTTTALIGHLLHGCGVKAAIGGNIGKPVLAMTLPPQKGVIVLEMSSYQIDLCPTFSPDIAVLTNITPDHLDRYDGMEGYIASKKRIFARGPELPQQAAIISVDDDYCAKIAASLEADGGHRLITVSTKKRAGVYVENGVLFDASFGGEGQSAPVEVFDLKTVDRLRGEHNWQNIACAYAAARLAGCETAEIVEGLKTFAGLPHRQYLVRVMNGVAYVNDSKATNAAATSWALASFRNLYWIVGGRPKDGGLKGLEPYMDRIRQAFLIGESMEEFASWLDNYGVPHSFCQNMEKAVIDAHQAAQNDRGQPGGAGTVMLSPACASFDQYRNFEERGDDFVSRVMALKEEV